jgi:hypothetical protein
MFELLKTSHSQSHNETTPIEVRQIGSNMLMGGESAYFVYRDRDRVLGFASPFVPKMRVSSQIRHFAIAASIDAETRVRVVQSLMQACAKWMVARKAKRCVMTIEDWMGAQDIIQVVRSLGFTEGLRMEGMRLNLLQDISGAKAP